MGRLQFTDEQYNAGDDQGYFQHVTLADIISNFMVAEVGDGTMLANTKRTIVEYHAQRAIQELTYDTLRSMKSREYVLDGTQLSIQLPQEAVGIIGVAWTDDSGYKHPMNERRYSGNPTSPLLDSNDEIQYDNTGKELRATESDLLRNFNTRLDEGGVQDAFYNYYAGSFENDELYDRYYSYYGRRYGSQPSQTNLNGTYVLDIDQGLIYIDSVVSNRLIVVDYVSDGIGDDLDAIRVHKFAEDAVYMYIRYKLINNQRDMPLYEKQLAKKDYFTTKKRAKLRLSSITPEKIYNAMLDKQKWIKR